MKIDWKMFPMKLHYILRYAGTGPLLPFLPVIARQKGLSDQVVGIIWTVMPFLSLVVKTCAGAVADYFRSHRAVFLSSLIVMTGALTGIYWAPDMGLEETLVPSGAANATYGNENGTICHENSTHCRTELPASELATRYEFWILFLWLLLQFCGYVIVLDLQETVCFQMLGDAPHKYGQQRLWGTISYGLAAMVGGALVDWYSKGKAERDYWPVHVMVAVFLIFDMVTVARLRFSITEKRISSTDVYHVLRQPTVILTVLTTVVLGASCGMIGTFHFLLVEDVAAEWDPTFQHLKLLQGLMLGVQCLVAEVPCLFLTGWLLERIGYVRAFLLSLATFCLRLCLYAAVSSPWWFLPIELLHGVSYALAFAGVASYANSITPEGAEATMQAIFGGLFFGGTGVGGLVGGWLFSVVGGWRAFLFVGVANGVYALMYLGAHLCLVALCPAQKGAFETAEEVPVPTEFSEMLSHTHPDTSV